MRKLGYTTDELIKWGGTGVAPENTFAGSAASSPLNSTYPVDDVSEVPNTSTRKPSDLNPGREKEYVPPLSNLPERVSQRESKEHNCSQGLTPWNAESAAEEVQLSGTKPATKATAPSAPVVIPSRQRDGVDPEGNTIEDAFRSLVRRGGGR